MNALNLQEYLRDMSGRPGFLAAALVELDGGMVWHAEGRPSLCDEVVSTASDYWRLYRRSAKVFSELGPLNVAILFHRHGRITVSPCGSELLLVIVTELGKDIDWETWKKEHAQLCRLVETF